jgi:hypothetical protein
VGFQLRLVIAGLRSGHDRSPLRLAHRPGRPTAAGNIIIAKSPAEGTPPLANSAGVILSSGDSAGGIAAAFFAFQSSKLSSVMACPSRGNPVPTDVQDDRRPGLVSQTHPGSYPSKTPMEPA